MAKPERHHWSWMVPEEEVVEEHGGGGLGTVLWMVMGAAAIFVALVVIVPSLPKKGLTPPAPTSGSAATPRPTITPGTSGGGGGPLPTSTLPSCTTVADTTTPCQGVPGALPQGSQEGQPLIATPAPLELAPTAVECWQGSFYTCDELAEMGDEQAIEAVQATDAFVDTSTLPTPAPAFVEYATDACAQAETKSILCP